MFLRFVFCFKWFWEEVGLVFCLGSEPTVCFEDVSFVLVAIRCVSCVHDSYRCKGQMLWIFLFIWVCDDVVIVGDFLFRCVCVLVEVDGVIFGVCVGLCCCWRDLEFVVGWCVDRKYLMRSLSGLEVDSFYYFYGYYFFLLDECWPLLIEWGVIGLRVDVVLTVWAGLWIGKIFVVVRLWAYFGAFAEFGGVSNLWQFRYLRGLGMWERTWHVHILSLRRSLKYIAPLEVLSILYSFHGLRNIFFRF